LTLYVSIWRYRVAEGERSRFERAYGPDGDWAGLFARDPGYLGTELLTDGKGAYVTLDRWQDEAAWARFKQAHGAAYAELDAAMEALTLEEHPIGAFGVVG
jgi:heme-degrading monooxygenase HmoA